MGKCLLHWKLDESSGSTASDETLESNDGSLTNLDTGSCWITGATDNGLHTDGVDGYAQVDLGSIPSTWTISAYVRMDHVPGSSNTEQIISLGTAGDIGVCLIWNHVSVAGLRGAWQIYDGTDYRAVQYSSLSADTWYELFLTYDGTTYRAYIDDPSGTPDATYVGSAPSFGSTKFTLGGGSDGTAAFGAADFDDVRFYNTAIPEPTLINEASFDTHIYNGETGVSIAMADAFDVHSVSSPTYTISTGALPGTLGINSSTGAITGDVDTDASDSGTYTVGVTVTTSAGAVEQTLTFYPDLQIKFFDNSPDNYVIKQRDCSSYPVASSTATTKALIILGSDISLTSSRIIDEQTGLTIDGSGEITLTIAYGTNATRGNAGMVIFQDVVEGWASPPLPVTFE